MIASLRGLVLEKTVNWILLEVGGIGYKLHVSPTSLSKTRQQEEAFFYIHDHIREDAHELFAFPSLADLELFDKLLSISGVGPKSAMTIMGVGSADEIRSAIMKGDLEMLTSVPGVGKKTAQKIILELKGQLVEPESVTNADKEVVDALVGMGYQAQSIKEVLKFMPTDLVDPAERIRYVLRSLSK